MTNDELIHKLHTNFVLWPEYKLNEIDSSGKLLKRYYTNELKFASKLKLFIDHYPLGKMPSTTMKLALTILNEYSEDVIEAMINHNIISE